MVAETRDSEHAGEMVRALKERYSEITFTGHDGALAVDNGASSTDSENDTDEEKFKRKRRLSILTTHISS